MNSFLNNSIMPENGEAIFFNAMPSRSEPYSYIFRSPSEILTLTAKNAYAQLNKIESAIGNGKYCAGFFSYELNSVFDGIECWNDEECLGIWGIYDGVRRYDHLSKEWTEIGNAPPFPELSEMKDAKISSFSPHIDFDEYKNVIERIHEAIRSGATYQVNYTFPVYLKIDGDLWGLFVRLLEMQPVPYASFQVWPDKKILSISPELFIHRNGRKILMKPMKGTASRCMNSKEDGEMKNWLNRDEKNRAENIMIVDMIRNDLGRIGTEVRVENLFEIEEYPTVWQMTSTVSCEAKDGIELSEILRAVFPSGSVTGAPKISTMKMIRELEKTPREVYCGAIGYILSKEEFRFSVPIRTLESASDNNWRLSVGSGITIDSDPTKEYEECIDKAKFVMKLVGADQRVLSCGEHAGSSSELMEGKR